MTPSLKRLSLRSRIYWTTCSTSININQTRLQQAEMKTTHVVTIRILDECERVICDLVDELHALMVGSVVNTALQNTAPVSVSGDLNTVGGDGIIDKLPGESAIF